MNPDNLSLSEISEMLGISLSSLSNWQKRYDDFPQPVQNSGRKRTYRLADIKGFITRHDLQMKKFKRKDQNVIWMTANLLRTTNVNPGMETALVIATFAQMWSSRSVLLIEIAKSGKIPSGIWSISTRQKSGLTKMDAIYLDQNPFSKGISQETLRQIAELWIEEPRIPSEQSRREMCKDLMQFATSSVDQIGIYSTSRSLANLINKIGRGLEILDISTGIGVVLDTYAKEARSLWGQDLHPQSVQFQQLLDAIEGDPKRNLVVGNSLLKFEEKWVNAFDVVICDPPLGIRNVSNGFNDLDPRWKFFEQANTKSDMDYWIQTVLAYLRESSKDEPVFRGILVASDSWLFVAAEQSMRTALIRRGHIEAVIRLGDGLASGTTIPMNLIIFRKAEKTGSPVRVIDASDCGEIVRGRRTLSQSDIRLIVDALNSDATDTLSTSESGIFCRDIPFEELLENDSVLLPRRYRPTKQTEQDPLSVFREVEVLLQTLEKKLSTLTKSMQTDRMKKEIALISNARITNSQFVNIGETAINTAPFEILFKNRPHGTEWTKDDILDTDIVICLIGPQIGECSIGADFVSTRSNWSRIAQLRIKGDQLSRDYLMAWLQNGNFQAQVDRLSGGTVLRAISKKDLNRIIIPIPNLQLQGILGSIAGQIEALNKATKDVTELNKDMNLRLKELLSVLLSVVVTNHNRGLSAP
jgi:type I restriction-modification system DNA methylase subunit